MPRAAADKCANPGNLGNFAWAGTGEDANLDDYVTAKALDGLFGAIAEEERMDPMRMASSPITKVFVAL